MWHVWGELSSRLNDCEVSSCHWLFIVFNFHFGEKWEFKFCGFLGSFDDLFYFEACVSLVPLAVLLYCYVTYCPGKFCKSGCSFYFVCSKELDRECDLVNVIVFLDWLVRSAHFCLRERKGDVCCLCSCSLIALLVWTLCIFESNLSD